jgi:hypothetical protein
MEGQTVISISESLITERSQREWGGSRSTCVSGCLPRQTSMESAVSNIVGKARPRSGQSATATVFAALGAPANSCDGQHYSITEWTPPLVAVNCFAASTQ